MRRFEFAFIDMDGIRRVVRTTTRTDEALEQLVEKAVAYCERVWATYIYFVEM